MSQRNKQPIKKVSPLKSKIMQSPQLQPQIEKTIAYLETILTVTQLNSTYFKSHLNFQKLLNKLEKNYFKVKMNAFLAIQNYRYDQLEVSSKRIGYETTEWKKKMASVSDELQFNFEEQNLEAIYHKCKKNVDYWQISANTRIKCQFKLQRLFRILKLKQKRQLSAAFYRLEQHREISMSNIYSEKSSKIETNDSQKSKIFQRSIEKKDNRKFFSLQKSGLSPKPDYCVPVKYQPSRVTNQLNINSQNRQLYFSQVASTSNKFIQNVGDKTKQRRNNLQINRQKKQTKHSSSQKYKTNLVLQQRQEKIYQLDYLRRKYKKIVDEFCWFSQRFLRVIEEEDYVQ